MAKRSREQAGVESSQQDDGLGAKRLTKQGDADAAARLPTRAEAQAGSAAHEPADHQQPDAAAPGSLPHWGGSIPDGWLECPPMGKPLGYYVPMKVPLGVQHNDRIAPEQRFTPRHVVEKLSLQGIEVGLVIDLTNSWRYYDIEEWTSQGIGHCKVAMRGHGSVPSPEAVNEVFWIGFTFICREPNKRIAIHCTHGYNRTGGVMTHTHALRDVCLSASWHRAGYVLVNTWLRLQANATVDAGLRMFATCRPPGIYKDDYIDELFRYHHERRPSALGAPALPAWKEAPGSPDDSRPLRLEEQADVAEAEAQQDKPMQHDDLIGEAVTAAEEAEVQDTVMRAIYQVQDVPNPPRFPGSQPVSLARANWDLLASHRFWVTWKADGTRYMLFICKWGVYAIDRAFRVRRTQMRFVNPKSSTRHDDAYGLPHHQTLLDGELVVDEDMETGQSTRRFLAYDMMMLNGKPLVQKPFKERWHLLEQYVIQPRSAEKAAIAARRLASRYNYADELFGIRRKDFWPLSKAPYLLQKFIPRLSHEADGLIFQPIDDPYVSGTCEELLKWKFAELNTVDFLFLYNHNNSGKWELCLMRGGPRHTTQFVPLKGARVSFPEGQGPAMFVNRVIECAWLADGETWKFLRYRLDKDTPNAWHVYEKVKQSIDDNIDNDALLQQLVRVYAASVYVEDRRRAPWPEDGVG